MFFKSARVISSSSSTSSLAVLKSRHILNMLLHFSHQRFIFFQNCSNQSISAPATTRSAAPGALRGSHPERRSDSAPGQPPGAALRQRSDPRSASAPIALQHKLCNFCTLFPALLFLGIQEVLNKIIKLSKLVNLHQSLAKRKTNSVAACLVSRNSSQSGCFMASNGWF